MTATHPLRRSALASIGEQIDAASDLPPVSGRWIYFLLEPTAHVIRYVGIAQNPASRYGCHMAHATRRKTPVGRWIDDLIEAGESPRMVLAMRVQSCSPKGLPPAGLPHTDFARLIERHVIESLRSSRKYGAYRVDLLNVHPAPVN